MKNSLTEDNVLIPNLDPWDFPDKAWVPEGWDMTQIPKASDNNMLVIMNKLNDVIDVVNDLKEQLDNRNEIKYNLTEVGE